MNSPRFVATILRAISLIAAVAIVAVVVLYPRLIAEDSAGVPHGALTVLLLGMSCAWVHGFGFIPDHRLLKSIFSPIVAWPLIALGLWGVFSH